MGAELLAAPAAACIAGTQGRWGGSWARLASEQEPRAGVRVWGGVIECVPASASLWERHTGGRGGDVEEPQGLIWEGGELLEMEGSVSVCGV